MVVMMGPDSIYEKHIEKFWLTLKEMRYGETVGNLEFDVF